MCRINLMSFVVEPTVVHQDLQLRFAPAVIETILIVAWTYLLRTSVWTVRWPVAT